MEVDPPVLDSIAVDDRVQHPDPEHGEQDEMPGAAITSKGRRMSDRQQALLCYRGGAACLALAIVLHIASLTTDIAQSKCTLELNNDGIAQFVAEKVGENVEENSDKIAETLSTMVKEMVEENFAMLAVPHTLEMVDAAVRRQVGAAGPSVGAALLPADLRLESPAPQHTPIRLLGTIRDLYAGGEVFLGTCILGFTLVFPGLKYAAFVAILRAGGAAQRKRCLWWTRAWGHWSMGDVFVAAFLVTLLKINSSVVARSALFTIRVRVEGHAGLLLFGSSVICNIFTGILLGAWHKRMPRKEKQDAESIAAIPISLYSEGGDASAPGTPAGSRGAPAGSSKLQASQSLSASLKQKLHDTVKDTLRKSSSEKYSIL